MSREIEEKIRPPHHTQQLYACALPVLLLLSLSAIGGSSTRLSIYAGAPLPPVTYLPPLLLCPPLGELLLEADLLYPPPRGGGL